MLECALQIQRYVTGKSAEVFYADPLLQDGVVRRLEVLGEASRQLREVLPEAAERFPNIPFRTMYALRNHLIHGYLNVDYAIVFEVAVNEVPALISTLEATLASWPEDLT